ncbi:hypothetical protein L3Q82_022479, partial [Scortum barcoo]
EDIQEGEDNVAPPDNLLPFSWNSTRSSFCSGAVDLQQAATRCVVSPVGLCFALHLEFTINIRIQVYKVKRWMAEGKGWGKRHRDVGRNGGRRKSRRQEPVRVGERWEEGVSGEAEKGESLSQVGLPKHDGLFTCQVVAFVWASHERQKRRRFSSSPSRTTSVVRVCFCASDSQGKPTDITKPVCKRCIKPTQANGANVSNLAKHLADRHVDPFREFKERRISECDGADVIRSLRCLGFDLCLRPYAEICLQTSGRRIFEFVSRDRAANFLPQDGDEVNPALCLACLSARVQGGFEMHIHERCRLGGESGGVVEANLGLAGEVRRTKGERRRGQEANLIELPANKPHLWAL